MLDEGRTTILNCIEDLTRRNLHTVTQTYRYASICAHAMKHHRHVRSLYGGTYHTILPTHIRD